MTAFALLMIAAAAGHALARWLRLPVIPVFIALGMVSTAGGWVPEGLGLHGATDVEATEGAARLLELGLAFLVFASGVELNPRRFQRQRQAVLWIALIQFGCAAGIGFLFARWMDFEVLAATYLAIGLAASSTLVVLHQLRRRRAMFEPFGRVVTGVLLLQDIAMILLMITLARWSDGGSGLVRAGLGTLAMAASAIFCQRYAVPWFIRRIKPDEETLLLWILAVLFLFVGAAAQLNLPLVAGAFFGGFAFSAFPVNGLVRGQIRTLSDFFQALFFIALGAVVGIPSFEEWLTALQFSLVVVVITPPLVVIVAEWRGLNARAAFESGLLLAQTSEYSLIIGLSGVLLGHIEPNVFSILALTTVMTMILTPFIGTERVSRILLRWQPMRHANPESPVPEGHILVLGFGTSGMWIVKPLLEEGHPLLVVDDDAVVIRKLNEAGIPCRRGDGSDPRVLNSVGASRARLVIASMRRFGDALQVLQHVRGVPVFVRVFEEADALAVERLGGTPILSTDVAAASFLDWFKSQIGPVGRNTEI